MATAGVAAACAAGGAARAAPPPPIPYRVRTTVRVVRAGQLGRTLRECRGPGPHEWTPSTLVVERRRGKWRSLTFRSADGKFLDACDSIGVRIERRRWCAPSTGTLYRGRLRDPRLNLCQARDRTPVAFIWVTPLRRARWLGVAAGAGRADLYQVAAGLPVRVASNRNIHVAGSSATFSVTQYDAHDRLLVRRTIVARVAG